MTLPQIERYTGREQAYVKHYFLATYLERLVHKVAASYEEIVYVDGFSGPWQNDDEDFADTSFGIALNALRQAKASWKGLNRNVRMKAILVEKRPRAFSALQNLQPKYPDVTIQPFNDDFRSIVSKIVDGIPPRAFAFVLVDPMGWRIPMSAISPLLSRPNTEILFNFMFDFINRAASMSTPSTVQGLNELLPVVGWREALANADGSAERKQILIDAFRQTLKIAGDYKYVAEVPVLRPLKDRTLYSLVYATRSATGIEVFRDCQVKTLSAQDSARGSAKVAAAAAISGQADMFTTTQGLGPDLTSQFLLNERHAAAETLMATVTSSSSKIWGQLWPEVLELHAVRKTELNEIAARLRNEGKLLFPGWQPRKRVPDDNYSVVAPDCIP